MSEKQDTGLDSDGELATPVYVTVTQEEIEKLEQECGEYKDKYLRLIAEFEY